MFSMENKGRSFAACLHIFNPRVTAIEHGLKFILDYVDTVCGTAEKMSEEEQQLRIDSACTAAEEFTKLYFESFDLKRHLMNKFYLNDATFAWDGNPAVGKDSIQKFLDDLPQMTHTLTALDAQPVYFEAVKGQQAVLVQVAGFITFAKEKNSKGFSQSFLITAQDNKWKIVNDSCRLQIPVNSKLIT